MTVSASSSVLLLFKEVHIVLASSRESPGVEALPAHRVPEQPGGPRLGLGQPGDQIARVLRAPVVAVLVGSNVPIPLKEMQSVNDLRARDVALVVGQHVDGRTFRDTPACSLFVVNVSIW